MELTLADQYYLKAETNYPYGIEEVVENINYALSYDDEHVQAHCLMGRIFMYQFKEYDQAAKCFSKILQFDLNFPDTYKYYSLLKIWQSDFEGALKLIDFGMKINGMDKASLLIHRGLVSECLGDFNQAKLLMEKALLFSIDNNSTEKANENLSRVKKKKKLLRLKRKGWRS